VCQFADAQTVSVGSGAPTAAITQSFIQAYYRNGFNNLVVSPPIGNVKALGTQGLVQEFTDATNSANKYALVKPNVSAPPLAGGADMVQMYPALYAAYVAAGTTTAGYPTTDTLNCPGLVSISGNSCQYQLFDKPYAIFAYKNALLAGSNFALAAPLYAKWTAIGGISTAGPAVGASSSVTSASANVATVQTFDQAMIFNMTAGNLSGRLIAVGPGVYPTYSANGGYTGFLGFPLTDEQVQPNGHNRQAFEGGTIDYDPTGAVAPVVLYPIVSILVNPNGQLKLNLGDTATLTASAVDTNGNTLSGRTISWTASNSQVLSLQVSGLSVTVKAIAGGTATVVASGEGKTSTAVTFVVTAPCCALGQGAPTAAIQQAFQDASTRNHLTIKLPAALPVTRSGAGYVQSVVDANTGAPYLLAISDQASAAYLVSGALLTAYLTLGGPSGALGYPTTDANAAGRQMFQNSSALAGNPVQLVSGAFLAKWATLGYEAGSAGLPTGAQASVLSFRATIGATQSFANGVMASAGSVYFVGGLIASAYAANGGAAGSLGLPLGDAFPTNGRTHQDFEGGYVDYAAGDATAQVHPGARSPLITATPSTVLTGTRVRLALGGFNAGATVKVSVTGQPDFTVSTPTGAYVWDAAVAANAKSGTVAIHAVDTASATTTADGSYLVRSPAEIVLQIRKASGDGQSGTPGGLLPLPLDIQVTDSSGNAVVGIPVVFSPSSGAQLVTAAAVTDSNGHATATLRMAPTEGIVLITAAAGKQLVTFNAQALHTSLASFPKLSQSNPPATDVALGAGPQTITQAGALLTATAAIVRYYQNQGALLSPNGLADPIVLNRFLQNFCTVDANGGQICDGFLVPAGTSSQIVNPWRLAAFVGGNLSVQIVQPDLGTVRDLLGRGTPVLLVLSLSPSGTQYVVGTGINADGSIAIMDPNPAYGKINLNDYLNATPPATLTGALQLTPGAPATRGFVVAGTAAFQLTSPSGACGGSVKLDVLNITFCDGSLNAYELDSTGSAPFTLTLTDLANPGSRSDLAGSGASAFAITHAGSQWAAAPQSANFTAGAVVNAASYTPAIAPGGLITIFGSGLAGASTPTTIQVNGIAAPVVAQSPYQVSASLPPALPSGTYSLTVQSPFGSATNPITLVPNAPAIFVVGAGLGAILNQDGTLNSPDNPANRGSVIVVYCTGLGATARQAGLDVATAPVTATLVSATLRPSFAGLAPGFLGLYQVNIAIPAATAPGLVLSLSLQQGGVSSNTVPVAIQ
jgi:uncharacterized protein (TIGR03437 family)